MDSDFNVNYVVMIAPSNPETWRNNCKPIKKVYYKLIKLISHYKKVVFLCNFKKECDKFSKLKNVELVEIPSNDSWARDILPIKCSRGGVDSYKNFIFNGYNGILNNYNLDSEIGYKFCEHFNLPFERINLVMEGGGIVSNGEIGIITEELLFNRNPNLSKKEIEKILKENLNLKHVLWLKNGLYLDECKGHADQVVAFKNKNEILLNWTDDITNKNWEVCRDAYKKIMQFSKTNNYNFQIHKICGHKPLKRKNKEVIKGTNRNKNNLVAISYINFLNLENVIILPKYKIKTDFKVYKQFKQIFKGCKIKMFNCREINLGGGGIHCVTKTY